MVGCSQEPQHPYRSTVQRRGLSPGYYLAITCEAGHAAVELMSRLFLFVFSVPCVLLPPLSPPFIFKLILILMPPHLQLPDGHEDYLCLGLLGRLGVPLEFQLPGRFLAILGDNVCCTKWRQGTLAQSNFRRSSNMKPLSRSVEWVDSVSFPIQPPFTSEGDARNMTPCPHLLTKSCPLSI